MKYPPDIQQMMQLAQQTAVCPFEQADAAAICFDILARYPDHSAAAALVYDAFCHPDLIREQRRAIGRLIDEWDDRPWQQRRRLALSFRHLCRWETTLAMPPDVADILREAQGQLVQDYLLGQSRGSELAWPIFQEAIRRSSHPEQALLWAAQQYADQGYFSEAAELLTELLAQFPKQAAGRRLQAEVCWWRDNQHRIPWIPPSGREAGHRYQCMMADVDPALANADPVLDHIPPDAAKLPPDFVLPPALPPELVGTITAVLNNLPSPPSPPADTNLIDWHYLDLLESGDIDTSRFPAWAQYLLLEIDDPQQEQFLKRYLLEYLANSDQTGTDEAA